tara:strand:- start:422 stop:571 length:150 start_codon:yes stop_codon:yes gene_type:complete
MSFSYKDHDLVFPNEFGLPLNPMAFTRALKKVCSQMGAEVFAGVMKQSG